MISGSLAAILNSKLQFIEPIHIVGASSPVRTFIVARFLQTYLNSTPFLVICSNAEKAMEFQTNLESLASILTEVALQVRYFPTWEHSPFSKISLSIKTRFERIGVLNDLVQQKPLDVIITSLPALSQASLPKKVFCATSISLQVGQSLGSRENLISQLSKAGYLRVDPVEDPGTFAVRGEIIDIFPPDFQNPIRVELFGDLVEKIRFFDPISQRTFAQFLPLSQALLPPAREVLINDSTLSCLREKIKARADDLGVPRKIRDPILASIREGIYPDHSDTWAPFAYSQPETLWDYLPSHCSVIWDDELSCQQSWIEFVDEQKRFLNQANEEAMTPELVAPPLEELFSWNNQLRQKVDSKTKIFLDRIELSQSDKVGGDENEKNRFKVSVQSNVDLLKGNRHSLSELEPQIRLWIKQGFQIFVFTSTQSQLERIRYLLEDRLIPCCVSGLSCSGGVSLKIGGITEGFRWLSEGLIILSEEEILGSQNVQGKRSVSAAKKKSQEKQWAGLQALTDLNVGDLIVHVDHGIGRYQGIVRLTLTGAPCDFLSLEYANKDKLYLPVYRMSLIQKFVGGGEKTSLDRLGSQQFQRTKDKVKDAVKKLAINLVQLYAERKVQPGIQFSSMDSTFREFEAKFPFEETPDQSKAIDAVMNDMDSGRVMDRLICGDVGYGKTEVAIRAAFRAVLDGKQVAVLVPTTLLAQQHEQSFKARLQDYPFIIESISRFKNLKEQLKIIEALAKGRIDIIIGTHRLLSKDIHFQDLGLIIVDEEHRFGVEHKERLKTLKTNTHVLTLSATPIPRTLHMALSGLRDISLIKTPPVDRIPIRTFISKYDEVLIQKAIEFELSRGGQVFVLHNRVQTIYELAQKIQSRVPSANVIVAHGQMSESELENKMVSFYQKKANVLVCTTIIESGLDVPTANTLIVDRADTLGLAQLYQIRGRVGRGNLRAYAYLLIPSEGMVTEEATRRLEVIQRFVELGSGFSIASHDLEIRGGGDILGPQQSGNIAAVGFELYTELLEEAIAELQGRPSHSEDLYREPEIKTSFPAFLSEEYVPEVHQRLSLYRRISIAKDEGDINRLEEELQDRFGDLPAEAQNLIWLIRIKLLLKEVGIDGLTAGVEKVSLTCGTSRGSCKLNPQRIIALVSSQPHTYQLASDSKLIAKVPTGTLKDLLFGLEKLFKEFLI